MAGLALSWHTISNSSDHNNQLRHNLMHSQRHSQRKPKPKKWYDDSTAVAEDFRPISVKTQKVRSLSNPLKPIPVIQTVETDIVQLLGDPLPSYRPPITVPLVPYQTNLPEQTSSLSP